MASNIKLTADEREAAEMLVEHGGEIAKLPFLLAVGDDVAGKMVKSGLISKSRSAYRITPAGLEALRHGASLASELLSRRTKEPSDGK